MRFARVAPYRWLCLLAVSLAAVPPCALADDKAPGLRLSFGAFDPRADTTIRLDSSAGGRGTSVNFEDTLDLPKDKYIGWFDGRWRIDQRNSLQFSYFGLNREGTRDIDRQIQFGDQTFAASTQVTSRFDIGVARLAYGFSFFNDGRSEVTGLIGVHATRLRAQISSSNGGQSEEAKGTAPLPVLGLLGVLGFSDRARVRLWADYFGIKYSDYDGHMTNFGATLEFDLGKNFGLGVGWLEYKLNLDATKPRLNGSFDLNIKGPLAYVNFLF